MYFLNLAHFVFKSLFSSSLISMSSLSSSLPKEGIFQFFNSSIVEFESISVKKNEEKIAIRTNKLKNMNGYGFSTSATIGDKHARECAQKFTIP